MDPLAEIPSQIAHSPYAYAWNNPIGMIDPTGMSAEECKDCPPPKDGDKGVGTGIAEYVVTASRLEGNPTGNLSGRSGNSGWDNQKTQMGWVDEKKVNTLNENSNQNRENSTSISQVGAIVGFMTNSLKLSLKMGANQEFKYGQTINGKFRSNEVISRAHRISSNNYARYVGYAGKAIGVYGFSNSLYKTFDDPSNPANWVKISANTGMLFLKANPYTLLVSVGFTVLDEGGYIDDWVGN